MRNFLRLFGIRPPAEPLWPVQLAVVAAIFLYITLPQQYSYGQWFQFVLPILEVILLAALSFSEPGQQITQPTKRRHLSIVLIILIGLTNLSNLERLVHFILGGAQNGKGLLYSALSIFLTNVIVFALWYWELDQGGPGDRAMGTSAKPDFLFPQHSSPNVAAPHWRPMFFDYLYVSATNATAFSPTDTMPLTRRAKVLMMIQALASLLLIALVAARAVNILQ